MLPERFLSFLVYFLFYFLNMRRVRPQVPTLMKFEVSFARVSLVGGHWVKLEAQPGALAISSADCVLCPVAAAAAAAVAQGTNWTAAWFPASCSADSPDLSSTDS